MIFVKMVISRRKVNAFDTLSLVYCVYIVGLRDFFEWVFLFSHRTSIGY